MRNINVESVLAVRAIAGLHVVTLAWDFVAGQEAKRLNLLGFAIERTELSAGVVFERFWLRGIKQSFNGATTSPSRAPLPLSSRASLRQTESHQRRRSSSTTVEITTEDEEGGDTVASDTRHDIHFNRGVAGSQAYARLFGKTLPDQTKPASAQMVWLSRGLFEALIAFIARAAGPDAADFKLRAMLYEFRYPPIGEAFGKAAAAGADVQIRYEAQAFKADNEAMIAATDRCHLPAAEVPRRYPA
ncbi:MAG TPA: hypothetical protein VGG82_11920 [Casimicrobiaceae bacterium]